MEFEHNEYTDYLKKFQPFGYSPKYDDFKVKALKRPYKIIIGGVYKISAGKTVWFIDYQESFKLINDKYIVLNQIDINETVGFGNFLNEYGTKMGGDIDFSTHDIEYCFDTVEEYAKAEREKRCMPIIRFKTEIGDLCI